MQDDNLFERGANKIILRKGITAGCTNADWNFNKRDNGFQRQN